MNKKVLTTLAILASSILLSFNSLADDVADPMQQLTQNAKSEASEALLKAAAMKELGSYNKDVTVMVKNKTVYLIGVLPSDTAYEEVITNIESSKNINNINADKLRVKGSQQPLTDTYITAKIKGTLIKHDLFGKDIPSWSISVETKDGIVYLSGTVKTEKNKLAVLNVVKDIPNVNKVEDKIKVEK